MSRYCLVTIIGLTCTLASALPTCLTKFELAQEPIINSKSTKRNLFGGYVAKHKLHTLKNTQQQSLLHIAARYNNLECAKILIHLKCKLNDQDSNGDTPLHIALRSGSFLVAKLLIASGANTRVQNYHKLTPLDYAVCCEDLTIKEFLAANAL